MQLDRDLYAQEARQESINLEEVYRTLVIHVYTQNLGKLPTKGQLTRVSSETIECIRRIEAASFEQLHNGAWSTLLNLPHGTLNSLAFFERLIDEGGSFIAIETAENILRLLQTITNVAPLQHERILCLCSIFEQAVIQAMNRRGMRLPRITTPQDYGSLERQLLHERREIAKLLLIRCGIATQ